VTTTTPPITLPRLEGETPKAYAARVRYVTMGEGRSLDKLGLQLGYKSATTPGNLVRWSQRYGWYESAKQYDEQLAFITVQEASQAQASQFRTDLEKHRTRYLQAADDLYQIASALLKQHANAITGRRIVEADTGKVYYIPAMKLDSATLGAAIKGLTTAADLAAHALDIPRLQAALAAQEGGDDAA
jgi:hypothetical protein